MNHAYETDNGPGGMSWQVTDGNGLHVADLARDSDLLPFAPITLHTYKDWVADHVLMEDSNRAALVIEAEPKTPWAEANDKLATLGLPVYDGSGCRAIGLGADVYGLVDWDNGKYRVGLYYEGVDDDGGVCAEFKDFESLKAFIARLRSVHAPEPKPEPELDPNFLPALRAFVEAGGELVDVWGDADQVAPLPDRLKPPLSLDEWLLELQAHYEGIR